MNYNHEPVLPASILILDDDLSGLRFLSTILSGQGYDVRPVSKTRLALSSAQLEPPDLILLDIMLMDTDGYQVCRKLKADPRTRDVPVIFISWKDKTEDKVEGFAVGGVDYIAKPYQPAEVLARVATHLTLRKLQREQQEKNARLRQEIARRKRIEQELYQTNRELETRAAQLTTLNRITQIAASTLELQPLLDNIARELTELFEADTCGIALLDAAHTTLTVKAEYSRTNEYSVLGLELPLADNPDLAQVIATRQSKVLPRAQLNLITTTPQNIVAEYGVQQFMVAPLLARGQVIGVVGMDMRQTAREFIPADLELAETIAGQLAGALDRARLFAQEQQQRQIAESLREVAQVLNTSLDRETVLVKIIEQLRRVIAFDSAGLLLLEGDTLRLVDGVALDRAAIGKLIPLATDAPTARAVKERRVLVLPDVQVEPGWLRGPGISRVRGWMGAPLIVDDQPIGALTVDSFAVGTYTEADAEVVQIFSSQAALAIKNARLYEQTRRDATAKARLLDEVNHRVKNNLAAIIGLLYMEQKYARKRGQDDCNVFVQDMINRVNSLAAVHSILAANEWEPVLLSDLAKQIIKTSLQTLPLERRVDFTVAPSPVRVIAPQATKLTLVLNELVTNTVKHAAGSRAVTRININIAYSAPDVHLEFRDDGPGYPAHLSGADRHNIGIYLIQTIVTTDLGGSLTLRNDDGAVAEIRFPAVQE